MKSEEIREVSEKIVGWEPRSRELILKLLFSEAGLYELTDEEIAEAELFSWYEIFAAP